MDAIYKILFYSINEGLIIADSDSNIVDANPRSHELFGYPENELIGLKVNELIPMNARERHTSHMANYQKVPTNRSMGKGMTLNAMRKDGSDFFAEVNQAFHEKLVSKEIPHEYLVRPGNHNWEYWRESIKEHLLFFNSYFQTNQ